MTTVYHPNVNTVVPWQANYTYPSQATQTHKQVVKIQPMGAQEISHNTGSKITFQLPSDGYLNARNSAFSFTLKVPHVADTTAGRVWVTSATLTVSEVTTVAQGPPVTVTPSKLLTFTGFDVANKPAHWQSNGLPSAEAEFDGAKVLILSGGAAGTEFLLSDGPSISSTTMTCAAPLNATGNLTGVAPGVYKVLISSHGLQLQSAGIHSIFKRVVIRYGGLVLEDIQEYNALAKLLLSSGASPIYAAGAGAFADGIGSGKSSAVSVGPLGSYGDAGAVQDLLSWVNVSGGIQRTFTFNLFAGLTTCQKLIPLKWMAASFRIELELAPITECFIQTGSADGTLKSTVSSFESSRFQIIQPTYIAELMEFDSVYDTAFYMGMQQMGVPLKFTSWHHQTKSVAGVGSQHYSLAESARSMKAAFAVIRDAKRSCLIDAFDFFHDAGQSRSATTGLIDTTNSAKVRNFQWRIGGRYAPAQPVDCRYTASEAYHELAKAINSAGDYTSGNLISLGTWTSDVPGVRYGKDFIMAQEFENTDVFPNTIAGINAENQSDLMLKVELGTESGTATITSGDKRIDTFISFDNLLIIREGHLVDLVM